MSADLRPAHTWFKNDANDKISVNLILKILYYLMHYQNHNQYVLQYLYIQNYPYNYVNIYIATYVPSDSESLPLDSFLCFRFAVEKLIGS